jgi:hypothetical protein
MIAGEEIMAWKLLFIIFTSQSQKREEQRTFEKGNSPFPPSPVSIRVIMAAPALWPNTVMRSGSPPKRDMNFLVHSTAAFPSCTPTLASISSSYGDAAQPYKPKLAVFV